GPAGPRGRAAAGAGSRGRSAGACTTGRRRAGPCSPRFARLDRAARGVRETRQGARPGGSSHGGRRHALRDAGRAGRSPGERGIPAVPWGTGARLLAGAFETPEQASILEARLKRAGVQARLVTRMGGGTTP